MSSIVGFVKLNYQTREYFKCIWDAQSFIVFGT